MISSWKYAATLMLGAVLLAGAAFAGSAGADGKATGAPKGAKGKVASPNPTVKPKIVDKNGKVVQAIVYVVRVDGMMWAMNWGPVVSKALKRLDGVEKVKIDIAAKTATITMTVGKTLTEKVITDAVDDSGFDYVSFKTLEPKKVVKKKDDKKKDKKDSKKDKKK